jgi:hypothetical protein
MIGRSRGIAEKVQRVGHPTRHVHTVELRQLTGFACRRVEIPKRAESATALRLVCSAVWAGLLPTASTCYTSSDDVVASLRP